MKSLNNKSGNVFWITGLSGSGKSNIGKKILPEIKKKFGPTILIHGDDLRSIFKINSYEKKERLKIGKKYANFCKFIAKQKINVIFTVVGLFHDLHKYNRKIIPNYFEIFIKSDIKKLIKNKDKFFYKKQTKNVWGMDLKPEFPKKPDVIIFNKFDKDINKLSNKLIEQIYKIYEKKK